MGVWVFTFVCSKSFYFVRKMGVVVAGVVVYLNVLWRWFSARLSCHLSTCNGAIW